MKVLITFTLVLVASTSAFISVNGLTNIFGYDVSGVVFFVIVIFGIGQELGKVLTVIHLHRNWHELKYVRIFYCFIIVTLVSLTSMEMIGFFSTNYQSNFKTFEVSKAKIEVLKEQRESVKSEIEKINKILDGFPETYVTKRKNYREEMGYEEKLNRLQNIEEKIFEYESSRINAHFEAGPIQAISEILKIDKNKLAMTFILILTLVMEPLSIGLMIATSKTWMEDIHDGKRLKKLIKEMNMSHEELAKLTGRKNVGLVEKWIKSGNVPNDVWGKLYN